jgi:hypothetical protein
MAEVQTHTESGEMTQRFIEFVLMHAQQAALCLGQFPHPQTGKTEANLEVARIFIDQLVMIRAKTRGNLSNEELGVLNNAISSLQMGFVEATNAAKSGGADEAAPQVEAAEEKPSEPAEGDDESKKKFTKSYGA